LSDAKIVESWTKNAAPWTQAVRENQIESRTLVTNQAVIEAVVSQEPRTVLDIGCGEGWLARALSERGVRVTGVDVVPDLIEQARRAGGADYRVASYEDVAAGALNAPVDVAVANFSLLGNESVEHLMEATPRLLNPGGGLVIQTLHPVMMSINGTHPYEDGWRSGSWSGFKGRFTDPAPWYFRTIGSWVRLLTRSNLQVLELLEPIHPVSHTPASLILIARTAGSPVLRPLS
jgi:2-polyprenyl-3-methyl-5-hydroxy-6-metoxy-1,4-benzoquinol methylase